MRAGRWALRWTALTATLWGLHAAGTVVGTPAWPPAALAAQAATSPLGLVAGTLRCGALIALAYLALLSALADLTCLRRAAPLAGAVARLPAGRLALKVAGVSWVAGGAVLAAAPVGSTAVGALVAAPAAVADPSPAPPLLSHGAAIVPGPGRGGPPVAPLLRRLPAATAVTTRPVPTSSPPPQVVAPPTSATAPTTTLPLGVLAPPATAAGLPPPTVTVPTSLDPPSIEPGATGPASTGPPAAAPATVPAPPPLVEAGTVTLEPGDSLWSVAERALTRALGHPPDEQRLGAYWWQVVERNRPRLPVPEDPDFVLPGFVAQLPPIGPASG